MKVNKHLVFVCISLGFLFGCDEYKTYVINTVHRDGSVLRTVIVKNNHATFEPGAYRVPLDSTWTIEYSTEISENQDTTWILRGEKLFNNVNGINAEYEADSGANHTMIRFAAFKKKYRWFNTVYRFSETVKGILDVDNPIGNYLSADELKYFYLPESVLDTLESGADSLYYRALADSLETKSEEWLIACLIKQWTLNAHSLLKDRPGYTYSLEYLESIEPDLVKFAIEDESGDDFFPDSLLAVLLGEKYVQDYVHELDSAITMLDTVFNRYLNAKPYEVEIRMPGKVIGSNGYLVTGDEIENTRGILWSVSGDYFLSEDYTMWVESRIPNNYARIISALFLAFAAFGLVWFRRKKY